MQFPALLADIGDAEGGDVLAGDPDRLDRGEGKILRRQAVRVLDDLLQRRARVRTPDADGDVLLGHVGDGDVVALVLGHPAHVVEVARAGVGAVDHAAAVGHADDRQVGAHHALVVEEVGVDALADVVVAADPGGAQPLHQRDMIRPFDVEHREMRQVHDAAILAHGEMLGIRHAPEMAVVPLVLAHRHAVAVFLQQVLVGGIAVRALPAAQLHEIAAQLLLALVERRAADVAAGRVGLARMDRRIVDLLRSLAAAALDERLLHLVRIEARVVDAWRGRSRCARPSSSRRRACPCPGRPSPRWRRRTTAPSPSGSRRSTDRRPPSPAAGR